METATATVTDATTPIIPATPSKFTIRPIPTGIVGLTTARQIATHIETVTTATAAAVGIIITGRCNGRLGAREHAILLLAYPTY